MLQNFHDQIMPIPDDFDVHPACLFNMDKQTFMSGLRELTGIIKSVYYDMIHNPALYGLPLVEDIVYNPYNAKAAESQHSAHRLVALLHTLALCGELSGSDLLVDNKLFTQMSKKLKGAFKITNSRMILTKLCDFGFVYDGNVFAFPGHDSVVPALYGYMRNVTLNQPGVFSINYFLAGRQKPAPAWIFAQYLSGDERLFFTLFDDFMQKEGFVVGFTYGYEQYHFAIEYMIDAKNEKRIARCYTGVGKLLIRLKLHSSDSYDQYTHTLPERIKTMFRKDATCRFCKEPCTTRLTRTFEGITYVDCGYGNFFSIPTYDPDDWEYYKQIILLEVKAERTGARRKGTKVHVE